MAQLRAASEAVRELARVHTSSVYIRMLVRLQLRHWGTDPTLMSLSSYIRDEAVRAGDTSPKPAFPAARVINGGVGWRRRDRAVGDVDEGARGHFRTQVVGMRRAPTARALPMLCARL